MFSTIADIFFESGRPNYALAADRILRQLSLETSYGGLRNATAIEPVEPNDRGGLRFDVYRDSEYKRLQIFIDYSQAEYVYRVEFFTDRRKDSKPMRTEKGLTLQALRLLIRSIPPKGRG